MTELLANSSDQVLRLFDVKAATWPSKYAADGRLTGRLTELVAAVEQQVSPGGKVLDLGCATGELARSLAARGYRLTGCDISAEMLDRAEAFGGLGNVVWVRLTPSWQALPFDTASFDAVVASSVLEYVDDPLRVVAECARVVRPCGKVLCTVPDPRHPVRWIEWLLGVAAGMSASRVAARCSPRLDGYLAYLRVSRQRHFAPWWQATAQRAGLLELRYSAASPVRSPLRLLTFQRPDVERDY